MDENNYESQENIDEQEELNRKAIRNGIIGCFIVLLILLLSFFALIALLFSKVLPIVLTVASDPERKEYAVIDTKDGEDIFISGQIKGSLEFIKYTNSGGLNWYLVATKGKTKNEYGLSSLHDGIIPVVIVDKRNHFRGRSSGTYSSSIFGQELKIEDNETLYYNGTDITEDGDIIAGLVYNYTERCFKPAKEDTIDTEIGTATIYQYRHCYVADVSIRKTTFSIVSEDEEILRKVIEETMVSEGDPKHIDWCDEILHYGNARLSLCPTSFFMRQNIQTYYRKYD